MNRAKRVLFAFLAAAIAVIVLLSTVLYLSHPIRNLVFPEKYGFYEVMVENSHAWYIIYRNEDERDRYIVIGPVREFSEINGVLFGFSDPSYGPDYPVGVPGYFAIDYVKDVRLLLGGSSLDEWNRLKSTALQRVKP